jgi:hypothetical protein
MMNGDKLPMFPIFTFFHSPSIGSLVVFALTAAACNQPPNIGVMEYWSGGVMVRTNTPLLQYSIPPTIRSIPSRKTPVHSRKESSA